MSQRKLMGALSILLLAILFIAVGCGDGKHSNNKTRINNKHKRPQKGNPPGGGLLNPNTPQAKAKRAAIDQAKSEFNRATLGERLSSLPEGDYTLSEVVSHIEFMFKQEYLAYFRRSSVSSQGTTQGQQLGDGLMRNNPEKNGREFLVPMKFKVSAGTPLGRDSQPSLLFTTMLKSDISDPKSGLKMKLEESGVVNAAASANAIVLTDILNLGQSSFKLSDGKTTDLFVLKTSADKIAIQMSISEVAQPGQQNNISAQAATMFSRHVVLVFNFKAQQATAPSAQPTQPEPQQQQQQQQQDQPQPAMGGENGDTQPDDGEQQPQGDVQ